MHMVSKKDLNEDELETVRISKNPIMVAANGEVRAKEEATVYVRDLDLFSIVMLLENKLAFLSLGKLCEDHWYYYHWTSGQKPHLIKYGRKINCNTANYVPFVVPGLSTSSLTTSQRNTLRGNFLVFPVVGARQPLRSWSPFFDIFAALNLAVIDTVMGHVNVHSGQSSDKPLRVAVPSQLRVSLHAWPLPRRFKNASTLW